MKHLHYVVTLVLLLTVLTQGSSAQNGCPGIMLTGNILPNGDLASSLGGSGNRFMNTWASHSYVGNAIDEHYNVLSMVGSNDYRRVDYQTISPSTYGLLVSPSFQLTNNPASLEVAETNLSLTTDGVSRTIDYLAAFRVSPMLSYDSNVHVNTARGIDLYVPTLGSSSNIGQYIHGAPGQIGFYNQADTVTIGAQKNYLYEEIHAIADPGNAPAGASQIYVRDNGQGKMQFVAVFPTGAVQVIATEP